MELRINMDDDLAKEMQRELHVDGEWFKQLPASVQIEKMSPYVNRQRKRDNKRLNLDLAQVA